jgi:hypothetical protein
MVGTEPIAHGDRQTKGDQVEMTTTHRIITAAVLLSLAAAGAPTAAARPAYDPPAAGNQTPTSVYNRPDKAVIPVTQPASAAIAANASVPQSLTPQQRQRVAALSALSDKQVAAGFGVASPVADKASALQAVVRVQAPQGGFDWGDAGIGAAGGLALAMLGIGGGLVISRQRPRRARPTTTLPN